jgi:hypothetical protein
VEVGHPRIEAANNYRELSVHVASFRKQWVWKIS